MQSLARVAGRPVRSLGTNDRRDGRQFPAVAHYHHTTGPACLTQSSLPIYIEIPHRLLTHYRNPTEMPLPKPAPAELIDSLAHSVQTVVAALHPATGSASAD